MPLLQDELSHIDSSFNTHFASGESREANRHRSLQDTLGRLDLEGGVTVAEMSSVMEEDEE